MGGSEENTEKKKKCLRVGKEENKRKDQKERTGGKMEKQTKREDKGKESLV